MAQAWREREDDDVREILAVEVPPNSTRSLHWVLDEVSLVWETGRNLKTYVSPGICTMTVWYRRVSVRVRLVCKGGSLSDSPCRSFSAHSWINRARRSTGRHCPGVPPDERRTWESGARIHLSRFQLAVVQAFQHLRVRRVGHRDTSFENPFMSR